MDKVKFLINMLLAFFIYPFNKHKFNGRDIWLIGGHSGDIYNDNSKFFYEYMLKEHNDVETYWVVNKDSKVFDKIPGKKINKRKCRKLSVLLQFKSYSIFTCTISRYSTIQFCCTCS